MQTIGCLHWIRQHSISFRLPRISAYHAFWVRWLEDERNEEMVTDSFRWTSFWFVSFAANLIKSFFIFCQQVHSVLSLGFCWIIYCTHSAVDSFIVGHFREMKRATTITRKQNWVGCDDPLVAVLSQMAQASKRGKQSPIGGWLKKNVTSVTYCFHFRQFEIIFSFPGEKPFLLWKEWYLRIFQQQGGYCSLHCLQSVEWFEGGTIPHPSPQCMPVMPSGK
jgi:hypothetical protein